MPLGWTKEALLKNPCRLLTAESTYLWVEEDIHVTMGDLRRKFEKAKVPWCGETMKDYYSMTVLSTTTKQCMEEY